MNTKHKRYYFGNILLLLLMSVTSIKFTYSQTKITYDFSCLEDDVTDRPKNIGTDLEKIFLESFGEPVKISEEKLLGDATLKDIKKNQKLIEIGTKITKLKSVLKILTNKIKNPRGFDYTIYLIESKDLNAFTCGGKIFVTTAMFDFCGSDDERACIIGHEIYPRSAAFVMRRYKTFIICYLKLVY